MKKNCMTCDNYDGLMCNSEVPCVTVEEVKPSQWKAEKTLDVNEKKEDMVAHPNHYQSSSGLEVKDVIEAFTEELTGFEAVATGNIIKYICRWKKKNGIEDIEKCKQYCDFLIEYLEKKKGEMINETTRKN
jgi:hypothetical protein